MMTSNNTIFSSPWHLFTNFCALILVLIAFSSCKDEVAKDENIALKEGFLAEKLFDSYDSTFGSWVSIVADGAGRIIVSDQYGALYRFPSPEKGETLDPHNIEKLNINMGAAQGMHWTEDGLFMVVNHRENENSEIPGSGFYKLLDTNGDDQYDQVDTIFHLTGNGEHGPHSIVPSPDNQHLYLIAGNGTQLPDSLDFRYPDIYDEDQITPVIIDPSGIFEGWTAPGGWILRMNKNGNNPTLWAAGFRNSYDIAFNEEGDLFTFDSDMEWDLGTPWYRPVRICHVVPGAEYGWRTGSSKWSPYYADNLAGIYDVGQGSPTGLLSASNLKFPAPYNQGIYVMDWSFGTMYHVKLDPSGGSYTAGVTEFLSGKGLPLTDMISLHGDMYFVTGGRRLNTSLYRVSYTGSSNVEPKEPAERSSDHLKRAFLEKTQNIDSLWKYLGSADRYIRFTARNSLELLEETTWVDRVATEDNPEIRIQSLMAVCRLGLPLDIGTLDEWVFSMDPAALSTHQRLDWLRLVQIYFVRFQDAETDLSHWNDKIWNINPEGNHDLAREKLKILAFLNDERAVSWGLSLLENTEEEKDLLIDKDVSDRSSQYGDIITLMRRNNPKTRRIGILEVLSTLNTGWTEEYKERYFYAFQEVFFSGGGNSYHGFVRQILNRALGNFVAEEERSAYYEMSGVSVAQAGQKSLADLPKPKGPGKNYSSEDIATLAGMVEEGDADNGKILYQSSLCSKCHIKGDVGSPVGPNLNTLGNRFSAEDILQAIINPSSTISDQYASHEIELQEGRVVTGRIVAETADSIVVNTNPFDPQQKRVFYTDQINKVKESNLSAMPAGLINRLNEQEVADLMAYLLQVQ